MTAQGKAKKQDGGGNAMDMIDVWIGTGRGQQSKGIYHTRLNTKTES